MGIKKILKTVRKLVWIPTAGGWKQNKAAHEVTINASGRNAFQAGQSSRSVDIRTYSWRGMYSEREKYNIRAFCRCFAV